MTRPTGRPRGRPPKPPRRVLHVYLTQEDYDRVVVAAEDDGSISGWARRVLLDAVGPRALPRPE